MKSASLIVAAAVMAAPLASCVTSEELAARDYEACVEYGFTPGTDAFANCRLELDQQRMNRAQTGNTYFVGGTTPATNSSTRGGITCFKRGESSSGLTRICSYTCLGSPAAITVDRTELCPLTITR